MYCSLKSLVVLVLPLNVFVLLLFQIVPCVHFVMRMVETSAAKHAMFKSFRVMGAEHRG